MALHARDLVEFCQSLQTGPWSTGKRKLYTVDQLTLAKKTQSQDLANYTCMAKSRETTVI